jgi:hypothetical protein
LFLFTLLQIVMNGKEGSAFLSTALKGCVSGLDLNSNSRRQTAMNSKIVKAALIAAALAGLIPSSSAQAQSYGGAPECGFGHSYNPISQSCVSNRDARLDYGRRSYAGRVRHRLHATHRVRVVRNGARVNGARP